MKSRGKPSHGSPHPLAGIKLPSRRTGKARHEIESSGYVAHSLEAALWCIATTENFRDAVLLAANLGGDADTTAAITGQLAGAIYGGTGIPLEWTRRVAWGDEIATTAGALFRMG